MPYRTGKKSENIQVYRLQMASPSPAPSFIRLDPFRG